MPIKSYRLLNHFLLPLLLVVVAVATGCTQRLGNSEAELVLEDIASGDESSRLKRRTPTPEKRAVEFQIGGRRYRGDVYVSSQGALAGIMLVPGVVAAGKDDPRLVALAQTLARARFGVLVPDLQGLRRLHVRASDVGEVADGFRYLVSRRDLAPRGRAGIAGFSYGAGPVVLAALEIDIRHQVKFLVTLGGFYDAHNTTTYFTTGYYRDSASGEWRYRKQNLYGLLVFAQSYVDLVTRTEDRKRLRLHIDELVAERGVAGMKLLPGLAPDAQALQTLLINRDPDRVPELIAQLSPRMRREMGGLNPAVRDLRQLQASMILVHGRGDNIIPYTESVALAQTLGPGRAELFLIDGFAHVDLKLMPQDVPVLLKAIESVLSQREEK